MGLAPAQSLSDKLAYGYGVHTAVLDTIAQESNAGTLSKADGKEALKLADDSRTLLDAGRTLLDSDPPGANQKLVLATAVLSQLQTYLRSHSQ